MPSQGSNLERDPLIGLRVQITIDEDGTPSPPIIPPGIITRRLVARDRDDYYLVRLDSPVRCPTPTSGEEWTLLDLVVATHFVGSSLDTLLDVSPKYMFGSVPVGIMNLLVPQDPDDPFLDFSRGVYFALGGIRKAD